MSPEEYFEEEEFDTSFDGKTFLRILEFVRPHWKSVAGFLVSIMIVSGLDAYFTYLSKRIIDEGIVAQDKEALLHLLFIYGIMTILQAVSVFSFILLTGVLGQRIRYDLSQKMFIHLQNLSLSYYTKTPVGWIMSRVTSDSVRVSELVTWGVLDITWAITNIITSMIFMLAINWQLALIVFLSLPILFFISVEFRKRILKEFRDVRKFNSKITGAYNENITGVRVVKALNREEENLREFKKLTENMYNAGYRAAWLSALFLPVVQIVSAIVLAGIVWYSGSSSFGGLSIGSIQAFISYVTFMMWPIQDLARVYAELQRAIASAERIFSLIDAVPDVANRPDATDPGSIQGDINFENVSFSYDDDQSVLKDFNLKVKRGETIALVGATGGGKSTIANLICRFYEPVKGKIKIGGQDYTRYSLQAIQSRIGMVPQTPHLFSGTIRENLLYGDLEASDEEMIAAARLVGADEFISQFSKGYDENVGEGGSHLSVGQKQLISLARAVLANPEIFIMDEATSSIDTLTEVLIQDGMQKLMQGRTSFIIAHRLSTIRQSDRILVIEGGRIVEQGSHAELLRKKGKYFQLYTKQFRSQMEQSLEAAQAAA